MSCSGEFCQNNMRRIGNPAISLGDKTESLCCWPQDLARVLALAPPAGRGLLVHYFTQSEGLGFKPWRYAET